MRDQGIDIGDRDEDFYLAVTQWLGDRKLVEITRIVIVDRRPGQLAQIADRSIGSNGRLLDLIGLATHGAGELGQQPAFQHCIVSNAAKFVLAAGLCCCHGFCYREKYR